MKLFPLLLTAIALPMLYSCEEDDICTDKVLTPRLIIRFKNANNPTEKKAVPQLLAMGKGKSQAVLFQTTDSIALPLPTLTQEATFLLIKNASLSNNGTLQGGETAELNLSFDTKDEFASRGCGYRTTYEQIQATPQPNSWISNLLTHQNHLKDEKMAIITILH